ncbi:MAG: Eco57I restriction-modification methylase domain-containing protein [Candidatus Hodarchaeota archaeon]
MKSFNRNYSSLSKQITNYLIEKGLPNDISCDFSRNMIKRSFLFSFFKLITSKVHPSKLSLEDYSPLFFNRKEHPLPKFETNIFTIIETLLPFDWSLITFIEQQDKELVQKKLKLFIDSFMWQPFQPINSETYRDVVSPQIFEKIFDLENSKNRGVVHTPYILAYWMVKSNFQKLFSKFFEIPYFSLDFLTSLDLEEKKVFEDWLIKIKVLDIAVGCGTFLLAAGHYLIKVFKCLGSSPTSFTKILYGVDINEKAIQICRVRLFLLILYTNPSILLEDLMKIVENFNLKTGNSLIGNIEKPINQEITTVEVERNVKKYSHIKNFSEFHWYKEFPEVFQKSKNFGFDIVIGNPPFIGYRNISREEKVILKFLYPSIYTGLNDLYYFFIQRSIELLNSNGFFALIVSRYFLEARYAAKLRSELYKNAKIETIIDFRDYKVFPGVGINTAIIFATKIQDFSSLSYMFILRNYDSTLFSILQDLQDCVEDPNKKLKLAFQGYKFNQNDLINETTNIVSEKARIILSKMKNQSYPLHKLCNIGTGFHSGKDAIFSKNIVEKDGKFFGKTRNKDSIIKMPLERDLIKEIIKTSDILPFIINWVKKYVIMTQRGVRIDSYPLTKFYLEQSKEKLIDRYEVKNGLARWYEIAQVRNYLLFKAKKKIVCPYRTKTPRFAIDEDQRYTSIDCTSIVPKKNSSLNIYYILGLLNSELIGFYLYAVTKKLDAQKIELYPETVSHIPVKIPKTDSEIALFNEITQLTKKIWNKLKERELTNLQKQELIKTGKKGFRKFKKDLGCVSQQISKLDLLVYKLYGCENQIKEIQEEIKILKP